MEVSAVPAAAPQPESQEDILAAALAALTDADIPPGEAGRALPDPDYDRPAELAGLSAAELEQLLAAAPEPVPEVIAAGFLPRDGSGRGAGFADGGELDVLEPGVPLAGFADTAHGRLGTLTDDELIGVLRAWRRQTSWAQARELAAVAELARRRPADRTPVADHRHRPRRHRPGHRHPPRPRRGQRRRLDRPGHRRADRHQPL
jgi:hypothetical protein